MTTSPSDISVVIPFYNREKYIDQAIQSVLAQTLKPLEILIVNDCSKESSRRFLDRYADVCKIVDLSKNVGLAGSRNAGIREARGEFIALLDDDDIWLPNKLEVQRKYMEEHRECALVHCSVWAFFGDQPDELVSRFSPGPMTLAQALTDTHWTVPSTLMIRSRALAQIGAFDVRFRECEDRDFMIRFAAAGFRMEGISEPLARLRREPHNSLSERRWRMFRVHMKIVWMQRSRFIGAYGLRGPFTFLLATVFDASSRTRYIDGVVRFLLKMFPTKWEVKSGYRDPVLSNVTEEATKPHRSGLPLARAGEN